MVGRGTQQREVALHAARNVQHDDEPYRLRRVVEQRDGLRLALVAYSKASCCSVGDEAAVSIHHGDEDPHGVPDTAKNRRLLRRRPQQGLRHILRESRWRAPDSCLMLLHHSSVSVHLHSYHTPAVTFACAAAKLHHVYYNSRLTGLAGIGGADSPGCLLLPRSLRFGRGLASCRLT